jgi:hypothetical protein
MKSFLIWLSGAIFALGVVAVTLWATETDCRYWDQGGRPPYNGTYVCVGYVPSFH